MIDSDLYVNMILGVLDIVTLYFAYCGFTNAKRNFSLRNILIGSISGCIMGFFMNYLGTEHSRIIFYIIFVSVIHLSYRKKIYNAVIVFVSMYFLVMLTQLIVVLLLLPFSIQNEAILYLIAQTLSMLTVIYISTKLAIHKILYKIEKELLITFLFLLLSCIAYSIFFYIKFEFTKPFYIFYLFIVLISLFGIYKTILAIYFYTNKLPLIKHDMENALIGIRIFMKYSKDWNEIYENIDDCFNVLDMNTDLPIIPPQEKNNMFYEFIQYKDQLKSKWKKLHYDIDIQYYKPHAKIKQSVVMVMLGILLDNAIQSSGTGRKIIISVIIDEKCLFINVANQFNQSLVNEFTNVFNQEIPKEQQENKTHGYGLFKLNKIVTGYGGKLTMEMKHIEQSLYIRMGIIV